ncbi:hypothetical protein Tco_1018926, partial [Tanacetum coccineum]
HQMHPIMYMEQMLHSTVKIPIDLLPGIVTAKNLTIISDFAFHEGDVDHLNLYTKCNPTAPVLRGSHNSKAKRLAKAAKDKSEEALRRMTLAQRMAQKQKLTDIDTKRVQQLNKSYLMCIETRDDELPITKFRYQNCSLKYKQSVSKNGRAMNASVLLH